MRHIICFLIGISIYACSSRPSTSDTIKVASTDSFQLPDSLFVLKNIDNSLIVNKFWYSNSDDELSADSVSKKRFVKLDSIQKQKLIVPVITKELPIDENYVKQYMRALFISKQNPVRDFTPIIVWVDGDDYGSLFYILLDKGLNPISYFRMNGGEAGGPSEMPDSTLELSPVRHSYLKGNKIFTYSVTEFINQDSIKRPSIFDSVNFESNILPSGQIETKRIDSTRYTRMSNY